MLKTDDAIVIDADDNLAQAAHIAALDERLRTKFSDRLRRDAQLTRRRVSFQDNQGRPGYRWYKYKEAFSASLVEYVLHKYGPTAGPILDPFAGMGTTLFTASRLGFDAVGIELLPLGCRLIETRLLAERVLDGSDIVRLRHWRGRRPWVGSAARRRMPALRITEGAYPPETLAAIEAFLGACQAEPPRVQAVLELAALCVLESVSYTRKDGQYLRWDDRAGRRLSGKPFNKGRLPPFDEAVVAKLDEILTDIEQPPVADLFTLPGPVGDIRFIAGSCLDVLPQLPGETYQAVVTSPPYCNRYDYTRTYALELALLGVTEKELAGLRQAMLSCTVENRPKDLTGRSAAWAEPVAVADNLELLQAILNYLEHLKNDRALNNPGIPRMVRGYFYEMACVIAECRRVLKSGGRLMMVNDNVRYAGVSVSVDLILSEIAERLGFTVENIFFLPNGKGNSSQQMGRHGRDELRKGVYVWRKG